MAKLFDFIRTIPYMLLFSISGYVFVATFVASIIAFAIFDTWFIHSSIALHISWMMLLLGFFKKDTEWHKEIGSGKDSKSIVEDGKTLAIILIMAAFLNLFGFIEDSFILRTNVFSMAVSLIYAGYILLCAGMALSFLMRLMKQRPHSQTKSLIMWIYGLAIFMLILQWLIGESTLGFTHVIGILTALIGIFNTRGLSWLEGISKDQKRDLAWSMTALFLSMVVIALNYSKITSPVLSSTVLLIEPWIFAIGIWLMINSARLGLLSLYSLPTAGLVDQKSLEFSSLAQLTSSANRAGDLESIIEESIELISKSIELQGLYCKIHIQNFKHETFHGILGTQLRIMCNNSKVQTWIHCLDLPETLPAIPKEFDPHQMLSIQSMMGTGAKKDGQRYGEMVLVHSDPFHFTPEDESMLSTFTQSMMIAIENAVLLSKSLEHTRLENEMSIARKVQQSLLPQNIEHPKGYDLRCFSKSAKSVGGDFYDVFSFPNGNTCLIIADVSGKGIPAAFWMATLRGTILSLQNTDRSAKELLIEIQKMLSLALDTHIFITAACIVLNTRANTVQFARAGHMPLILKNEGKIHSYKPKGLGIGLTKDISTFSQNLDESEMQLKVGDMCLLYTDGLSEILDEKGIEELLLHHENEPLDVIRSISSDSLMNETNELIDDITIIAFKRIC